MRENYLLFEEMRLHVKKRIVIKYKVNIIIIIINIYIYIYIYYLNQMEYIITV